MIEGSEIEEEIDQSFIESHEEVKDLFETRKEL
jgi:hypothetical protein